jgi:GntR family transcriptional regulator
MFKLMTKKRGTQSEAEAGALMRVDPRQAIPLHAQVEQAIRRFITATEYQQGALLPDELTLAGRLGVSRGTIRSGISRLVNEGLLERRAGVGTRVARAPAESGIAAWRSFTREMAKKGIQVQTFQQTFRQTPASADAAQSLAVQAGTPLWRLDRVRGWDDEPVLHSSSWFHPRLKFTGKEEFNQPLYEVIEANTGAVAENAREEFLAVAADAKIAKVLQAPKGAPLLLRRHSVFDRSNRPMEFAEVHYVSSRFTLTLDLRRD